MAGGHGSWGGTTPGESSLVHLNIGKTGGWHERGAQKLNLFRSLGEAERTSNFTLRKWKALKSFM